MSHLLPHTRVLPFWAGSSLPWGEGGPCGPFHNKNTKGPFPVEGLPATCALRCAICLHRRKLTTLRSFTNVGSVCPSYGIETKCIIWETDKPSIGNGPFVFLLWKGLPGPPLPTDKGEPSPTCFFL